MNALLIDIGNSRVKARLTRSCATPIDVPPLALDRIDRLDDHWQSLHGETIDVALISNVADPGTDAALVAWLRVTWPMVRVEHIVPALTTAGVINGYRHPERLGSDRWMALVGAHAMLPDRSLLVCNFGTATTLDLLVHDATANTTTFIGGSILPGEETMRTSLLENTARLQVHPGAVVDFADNTEDAIVSGVMLAQRGAVRLAWDDARKRAPGLLECIVAGGGSGPMLRPPVLGSSMLHHVPDLVLRGLAVYADERAAARDTSVAVPHHD